MNTESRKIFHTDARGNEPFDHSYGIGYQVGHKGWSPYGRVNDLRDIFLKRPYNISTERLELVTEAYEAHRGETARKKCAYAFANVLKNCTLYIYDRDLILGELCAEAKEAPVYPEFSVDWILDEMENHPFEKREHDQFYVKSDIDREKILSLCRKWQGHTVADLIESRLDEDQLKGSEAGKKIFQTNLYHYAGTGHLTADYARLLKLGLGGIRREAEEDLGALSKKDPDYFEKKDWYESVIIVYRAASDYIRRYEKFCLGKASATGDPERKTELLAMGRNCEVIAEGSAQTFWQALQLFHFVTELLKTESNGHSISYGRMDQWLYPYYEKDLQSGDLTREFAGELLECEYVKMNNATKLKDWGSTAVRNGRGFGGESLTIGGVDREGRDATNDLTMLMLEASAHTRMMNPWVCVRMHEKTPMELLVKTACVIRAGFGHPKIVSDATCIKMIMRKGVSLEEARDYAIVGCVEPDLPGHENGWHDAAYVNLAKILEMAINGGRCISCGAECPRWAVCGALGKRLGPDTGSLAAFRSMDELLTSVRKQMDYWSDQMTSSLNIIDRAHQERKPLPFASGLFSECVNKGIDLTAGGAKINGIGPQASGLGTCADSLSAICQAVFDEKKVSGAEYLQALKDNWEGHEKLYAWVNGSKCHHYGNDDDYADRFFKFMFDAYVHAVSGRKNTRGGEFYPGVYSVNANVAMGMATSATADGRKAGEAISDNMGPVHTASGSHDCAGPTALVNSLSKVDHSLAENGTLMNMKFPQDAVAGPEGLANLVSFIRTYIHKGPMHVQFNIMSTATMKDAQKHPSNYRDMLVRVAGYSAYFIELGLPLQNDLIQRSELHF